MAVLHNSSAPNPRSARSNSAGRDNAIAAATPTHAITIKPPLHHVHYNSKLSEHPFRQSAMKLFHICFVLVLCFLCFAEASIGPPQLCRCYPPGSPASDNPVSTRGQCQKRVRIDIKIVADDGVILYICGQNVRQTSNFDEIQEFTYEAMCDEMMLEVNNKGLSSGVSVLATYNGQTYGTTGAHQSNPIPGVRPLFASAVYQPTGDWTSNSPDYDYSSWTPAVLVQSILDVDESIAPNFHRLAKMGAFPINTQNGDLPPGKFGLRLSVPFCG